MDKKEQRNLYLKQVPENYINVLKDPSRYGVTFGPTPEKINWYACFAQLWHVIHQHKTMYYIIDKRSKDKLKYFAIIKSIQRLFKDKFTIVPTTLNTNKIIVKVSTTKTFNRNFTEAGFIIIAVLLRTLDTEYLPKIQALEPDTPIEDISTLLSMLSKPSFAMGGHGVSSTLLNPDAVKTYIKNIRTIYGSTKHPLKKEKLGDEFTQDYRMQNLVGYDFAYNLILKFLEGKLK